MPLTRLPVLLLVGHLVTVTLAQNCPQWANRETCEKAEQIRRSPTCMEGGPTGFQRPLYDPPTNQYSNTCICASTYYSLVSACELCNGGRPVTWGRWHSNCNEKTRNGVDEYPTFGYPEWAKLRYNDDETFTVERAVREGGASIEPPQTLTSQQPPPSASPPAQTPTSPLVVPTSPNPIPTSLPVTSSTANTNTTFVDPEEVTLGAPASSAIQASTSPSEASPTISTTPTVATETLSTAASTSPNHLLPNPSDDPLGIGYTAQGRGANNANPDQESASGDTTGNSPNVGAIVGGVVGGLSLILLSAGLLYFFVLRSRRKRIAPSAAYMAQFGDGRVLSPRPFTPDPAAPVQLHSTSSSVDNARPDSPTLPRPSTDVYSQHPSPFVNLVPQDPFNPPENPAEMRESNNMSRQSTRRYTRTPTPLIGPRAIR